MTGCVMRRPVFASCKKAFRRRRHVVLRQGVKGISDIINQTRPWSTLTLPDGRFGE